MKDQQTSTAYKLNFILKLNIHVYIFMNIYNINIY